ncbi:LuxR family transcriptional regulator [Acrocarpospora corrugata]|uniref:LuxR family transcriptional regulator n=1 Tax=Acrocarpospora corrugata TaxID=35763 RepID=A0A5M3W8N5_9ACTN|nr:AAA family ATPase [Acrocarpospora corrugata]GES03461.1 LuxR family transcriptional regulator [Acrocarpospora corrugata]
MGVAGPKAGGPARRLLVGRDQELDRLFGMVDQIATRGGALVVRGEAGIGKSALLAAAGERARERGAAVVTTTGTQSEARLAFGGLHQLLLPFLDRVGHRPDPQRKALDVAFGATEGDAPDLFLIGLATLGVITEREAQAPLLLVVEDAHWLDRSSAEVLAFVARRLEMEPVILLFAVRDGVPSALDEAGLPDLTLVGLDADASRTLIDVNETGLSEDLKRRILAEAAGNPLALIELPAAAVDLDLTRGWEPLPLTARLEATFATRLAGLDADVRALVLLAALHDGNLAELNQAAEELLGGRLGAGYWAVVAAAGLGTLDDGEFRFRHPLIRSAVYQAATGEQRRSAHRALARTLAGNPDRAVWHRAAAAPGPVEEIASALVAAADRATDRGGLDIAFAALERAAGLSADPRLRALRLARAGNLANQLGRSAEAVRLLRAALQIGRLPAHEAAMAAFDLETLTRAWSGASTIRRFARIAEDFADRGDGRRALEALGAVSVRAYWDQLDDKTRRHVSVFVERLAVPADDPQRLAALGLIDPIRRGPEVIARVARMSQAGLPGPDESMAVGRAAMAVWADNLALPFLRSAVAGYRADGRLARLAQCLMYEAWADVNCGAVRNAITSADEAARLAGEVGQVRFGRAASLAHAIAVAELREEETADHLITDAEGALVPMGASPQLSLISFARGRAALAADRPAEAYHHLARIYDPADASHQPYVCGWALADLVDAAVRGDGDLDLVRGLLTEWEGIAVATGAPHLEVQVAYAGALLADDETAERRFQAAMTSRTAGWPFYTARTQLAYGGWLRRRRRGAESRTPLREAARVFDALGLLCFADRARRELRASGERARRRVPAAWAELSPQELQIAQLAAEGLSNRDIGERLYLSHRTVSTHLHRLFPKLGITSRAQLRDALRPPDGS